MPGNHGRDQVERHLRLGWRALARGVALGKAAWDAVRPAREAERTAGAIPRMAVLDLLHHELRPAHYLEIGVGRGTSLVLARGPATGVDPKPAVRGAMPATTRLVPLASDAFFAQFPQGLAPDFCFIDGLHLFEYALRDFVNCERRAAPAALLMIDDIFPNHPRQAARRRRTRIWTGDVWRLVDILSRHRPDLFLLPIDARPAGLLLVAGLDPGNRVLSEHYDAIVAEARRIPGPPRRVLERRGAISSCERLRRVIEIVKSARRDGARPHEMVSRLRQAQAAD